jgi:hypothetical protein
MIKSWYSAQDDLVMQKMDTSVSTLKIVNNQVAQEAIWDNTGSEKPKEIQSGVLLAKGSSGDLTKPSCETAGVQFRPDPSQTYKILNIRQTGDENNNWTIISIETKLSNPQAYFVIFCKSALSVVSMDDVKSTLRNIYEISP